MEKINVIKLSAVVNSGTEFLVRGIDGKDIGVMVVPKTYNRITLEFLQEFIVALGTLRLAGLESHIIIIQSPALKMLLDSNALLSQL